MSLSYPYNRPWRPIGLWDVEAPIFSRQSAHRWRWGCQPYAPEAPHFQEDSWYSFGSFVRGWVAPGAIVRLEGLGQFSKFYPFEELITEVQIPYTLNFLDITPEFVINAIQSKFHA
jgi:hypothetical protein